VSESTAAAYDGLSHLRWKVAELQRSQTMRHPKNRLQTKRSVAASEPFGLQTNDPTVETGDTQTQLGRYPNKYV
jgi:hypothetical protein